MRPRATLHPYNRPTRLSSEKAAGPLARGVTTRLVEGCFRRSGGSGEAVEDVGYVKPPLPVLASHVFVRTLQDMGVRLEVSLGEADDRLKQLVRRRKGRGGLTSHVRITANSTRRVRALCGEPPFAFECCVIQRVRSTRPPGFWDFPWEDIWAQF